MCRLEILFLNFASHFPRNNTDRRNKMFYPSSSFCFVVLSVIRPNNKIPHNQNHCVLKQGLIFWVESFKARTSREAQRPLTVTYQERKRMCIFESLTWCQEEAASGFVHAVAGKRCRADDDEPAQHHGHHADQHEDAPEAPVNCRAEGGSADGGREHPRTADLQWEVLTDGRVVFSGVVGLVRDGEWEEVGVHAHFGVRLVYWRQRGGNKISSSGRLSTNMSLKRFQRFVSGFSLPASSPMGTCEIPQSLTRFLSELEAVPASAFRVPVTKHGGRATTWQGPE